MNLHTKILLQALYFITAIVLISCKAKEAAPSKELISQIGLKRGTVISCSPGGEQFGSVDFEMSCNEKVKKDFNLAIELLHSFEYDEAEKAFAKVIDAEPACAMAYWGVAMSNFHPLWTPPSEAELKKGSKAVEIAQGISSKSAKEAAYINAIGVFYKDWEKTDHRSRCLGFEKAMEQLHNSYPADKETAIFYALALDAAADPSDKNYTKQRKAGALLNALYPSEPGHPGIIHYIIHTFDYPGLAEQALSAARRYAQVAPSSAHALHMPSHIFTRLGLWDDCTRSNHASVTAAKCYAESAGIKGHWDEELHGLDYLVYAYLQKAENDSARDLLKYIETIKEVQPPSFKVAYAFAAIPARICLENKNWNEAAGLQVYAANVTWSKFPWQRSIIHFTRLLGAAHLKDLKSADAELVKMKQLRDELLQQKDIYKARQVSIQVRTGEAWIQYANGNTTDALNTMKAAAAVEDSTEKHPVTPGEVLPAKELLADMLLQSGQNENALIAYEAVLKKSPNRFNSLYGAAIAADRSGDKQKAMTWFKQLISICAEKNTARPELNTARAFLKTAVNL